MNKKMIVVFSGAGMSADSGLPTFRFGVDALWENHPVDKVAQHDAWFKDRALVLKFYEDRYIKYKDAKPHAGHKALVELEQKYNVIHITQNIDNLLEQAGATNIRHLHGNISWRKCEWHKEIIPNNAQFACDFKEPQTEPVKLGDLCPRCGGQMRPDIVMFNEAVPSMNSNIFSGYIEVMKDTDGIFIVCGTALQAFPASYIVPWFSQVKRKYLVDPQLTTLDGFRQLRGGAAAKLPELVEDLMYL